jgi:hypothetical protein
MLRRLTVFFVSVLLVAGCNGGSETNPPVPLSQLALYVASERTTVPVYALPFSSTATPYAVLGSGFGTADDTTADASGHLFVLDDGPSPPQILEFNRPVSTGSIPFATIKVTGASDCPALTTDPSGNLWISCFTPNTVEEIAGPFTASGTYNGTISATLNGIGLGRQVVFDAAGDLFAADEGNNKVQIYKAPVTNGNSPSGSLTIIGAFGVALDGAGNVYASSDNDNSLRRWNAPISLTAFNRAADIVDTSGTTGLTNTNGISTDTAGNLYVGTCASVPTVGSVALFSNVASTFSSSSTPAFVNSTTGCARNTKVLLK